MSQIDEKIAQCKKDIESLRGNLEKLKDEKKRNEKPKFGDIVGYDINPTRKRVMLYDSTGTLRAFSRCGGDGFHRDNYVTTEGKNIFKDNLLNLDGGV